MAYYNNEEYMTFIKHVLTNYKYTYESEITSMLDAEIDRLERYWTGKKRKTKAFYRDCIYSALENCRNWLNEPIKIERPSDIANNCISRLYFSSLHTSSKIVNTSTNPKYTIEDLKQAFFDLLDGEKEHDISYQTGLSEKRTKEIYHIFQEVSKELGY